MNKPEYERYTSKSEYFSDYLDYQRRYRERPRESDKRLVELLENQIKPVAHEKTPSIVDLGCSNGNLLYLLKNTFSHAKLFGIDFSRDSIDLCRRDPDLSGIAFEHKDILTLNMSKAYDVVILNAVSCIFKKEEFRLAVEKCYESLVDRGMLVFFDYFHEFDLQHLSIIETSQGHPEGMLYHYRPISWVRDVLRSIGFLRLEFHAFSMEGNLTKSPVTGELYSHTKKMQDGSNLCFRGALCQPWCHLVAQK